MLWFAPIEVILKQGVLFEFHLSTTGTHHMFIKFTDVLVKSIAWKCHF